MRVKLNSLFTSSNQRFGRQWSYRFQHDFMAVLKPAYWLPAVRRLRAGDTVMLVQMSEGGKRVIEAHHVLVSAIAPEGVHLGRISAWWDESKEAASKVFTEPLAETPQREGSTEIEAVKSPPKRRGRPRKVVE